MKRLALILCAAVLAAMPMASQAGGFWTGDPQDDRRHHRDEQPPQNQRRGGDDRRGGDRRDDGRYNNAPPPRYAPPPAAMYDRRPGGGGGYEGGGNGMDRASAIGRGHGRVLNVWPQGGSLFLVRVDTPRGRVDMIVDVDTGRVVGER